MTGFSAFALLKNVPAGHGAASATLAIRGA